MVLGAEGTVGRKSSCILYICQAFSPVPLLVILTPWVLDEIMNEDECNLLQIYMLRPSDSLTSI